MKYPISFKYRFELLLPLFDNEGNAFEPEKFLMFNAAYWLDSEVIVANLFPRILAHG